ncbi:MAG: hypothetical protein RI907_504 [Pseudomonadota bacterium]|jgi:dihydroflavonol-4-reductase
MTGATGFIGRHVVQHLLQRGHEVVALVRRPEACGLPAAVTVVPGDLGQLDAWAGHLPQVDAVLHLAASYRIGVVGRRERDAMAATNVAGTAAVLAAAVAAQVPHIVHVSSTAALGETHGQLGDEGWRHNGVFRSFYEQTKHVAHGVAVDWQRRGAPVSVAVPGGVFGEGDGSDLALALRDFVAGRLPLQVACHSRFQLCHVSQVCDGLVRVLERGEAGRHYLLTGELVSLAELLSRAAQQLGLAVPRAVPREKLQWLAALGDGLRPLGVRLPLTREALAVMDGSSYTYGSARAATELGWPWQAACAQFWPAFDAYIAGLHRAARA